MSLPNSDTKIPSEELTKEETIKFLDEDEPEETLELEEKPAKKEAKTEEAEEEEVEKEEEEEKDELDELEEELEGPDEEKLELIAPVRRKEILAKYPKLFKEFPYLERAYYREQKYTEIFPTIEDAEGAVTRAKTLDSFERDLNEGNTENILNAVKKHDENAFYKIVDNYLPTLGKIDQGAYFHVLGTVIKNTIISMVNEANKTTGDTQIALKQAAHILQQYVFGTNDFETPKPLAREDKKEDDTIKKKEAEFQRKQFEGARDGLNTKVDNVLKATINANIDPKSSMTDYVKKNASREALENLTDLLDKDTRFRTILDKLWEQAFKNDFKQSSLDKIKSTYLSRAKTILPIVIKKARNEALKGLGKRVKEEEVEEETEEESTSKKGPLPVGRTASDKSPKTDKEKSKQIPAGMRTLDYLMQD